MMRPAWMARVGMLLAVLFAFEATPAGAQTTPTPPARPITIVNPASAGSTTDGLVRALAPGMAARLGQTVVVVNREGGAGAVGTLAVARAAPDGTTLLFTAAYTLTVLPVARPEAAPYALDAFEPVCQTFENQMALVVAPDSTHRSLAELVAAARARPGALSFGHQGVASIPHLAVTEFAQVAELRVQDVPYRGEPAVVTDLLGGRLDFAALVAGSLAGRNLRVLGLFADARHPQLPDVPTVREAGFAVAPTSFGGLFAPAGTPPSVRAALESACLAAAREEAYTLAMRRAMQPADPVASGAVLGERLRRDAAEKVRLLRGITVER